MDAFFKGRAPKPATSKETTKEKGARKKPVPWVEKYRPKTVEDVAQQEEVVAVLKKSLTGADLPNLLFYGPPGTGKTSTILALSRELYGPDIYKDRILELNASDERGIQVVREKVKKFSQLTAASKRPDGKPCPPFKIVILDEADSMTGAAQAALRRTMEKQSRSTRFCLICNYVSRIIEPITSRCAKFRFKPLDGIVLENALKNICTKEGTKYTDEAIQMLMTVSEGDLRKAITYLQSCHRLKGDEGIEERDICEIAGVIPKKVLDNLIKVCHSGSYEKLELTVKEIIAEGHSASQLLLQLHDVLMVQDDLSDQQKSVIFERVAIVDKCLLDGADEYLQIMDLSTIIMDQICNAKK